MGVSGQCHASAALYPWENTPGTHCTGCWVGLRAGLDTEVRGKILCLCQGSNPSYPICSDTILTKLSLKCVLGNTSVSNLALTVFSENIFSRYFILRKLIKMKLKMILLNHSGGQGYIIILDTPLWSWCKDQLRAHLTISLSNQSILGHIQICLCFISFKKKKKV
jgi:hypothetical protein